MFRPLWGGPHRPPVLPLSRDRGGPGFAGPARPVAACGELVLGRQRGRRDLPGQGRQVEIPHRTGAGPDLADEDRRPQHRREDRPGADRDVSIAGEEGEDLLAPLRDPRPPARTRAARPAGLGARRRLSADLGGTRSGGAHTSSHKTFDFGPLKAGKTVEGIWKLSAVKAGRFTVLYGVDAGLGGEAKAETDTGVAPGRLLQGAGNQGDAEHRSHRFRRSRRNRQGRRVRRALAGSFEG